MSLNQQLVSVALAILAAASAAPASAGSPAEAAILPPELPWEGASLALMASPDDPWVTPAERTGLTRTPSYAETVAYIDRLVAAAPELTKVSLGVSPEGRDIWMVIAAAGGASTPEALRARGKPVLFAHAGIHSGEIDGKDAGLMLLRDMTVAGTKSRLLEGASFLFVPILNVDGHERSSAFNRINQRGPEEMGWRTTSRNLNLNRDFTKLDTPEMRALVAALERWQPDLYFDLHVTDGADYQYDITFGFNGRQGYSPAASAWLEERLAPALERDLAAMGHIPGPLVFLVDAKDPRQGNFKWTASPRYSNGYGDARHLPTVLVENHSLKPYRQRVLGTYVLLESALETLAAHGPELRRATRADRARRPEVLPLSWRVPGEPPKTMEFLAVTSEVAASEVTGGEWVRWTGEPVTLTVPVLEATEPAVTVTRPRAYWIHPAWSDVIARLAAHGIEMETISEPREVAVEMYRVGGAQMEPDPFEGHVRLSVEPVAESRRETFPAGSVRVPTDQPLGDLGVLLLEPASPDSFFQWGFFLEILQRTEYAEAYVMEPMAAAMLAADPELAAEYEKALADDPELAADPRARRGWFYRRTPYFDERWGLYPVAREVGAREPGAGEPGGQEVGETPTPR